MCQQFAVGLAEPGWKPRVAAIQSLPRLPLQLAASAATILSCHVTGAAAVVASHVHFGDGDNAHRKLHVSTNADNIPQLWRMVSSLRADDNVPCEAARCIPTMARGHALGVCPISVATDTLVAEMEADAMSGTPTRVDLQKDLMRRRRLRCYQSHGSRPGKSA